jgi:hypothetical protein
MRPLLGWMSGIIIYCRFIHNIRNKQKELIRKRDYCSQCYPQAVDNSEDSRGISTTETLLYYQNEA